MTIAELELLHELLGKLRAEIDAAPERHEKTPKGHLADADWGIVMLMRPVVHRVMLWRKFPSVSEESYLAPVSDDVPEPQSLRA